MEEIRKGTIIEFQGSWMSGLAQLIIEDSETGITESICCENGQTVRALDSCYGNFIDQDHTVNNGAISGKEILWTMDGFIFGGFTPVEDAPEKMWDEYEKDKIKRGEGDERQE